MSRNRMTWNTHKQATPPPQIPSVDRTEKGDHPAYYPDPAIDDFAKGDPDAWAETPKPPPYLETAPPNMPGNLTTEQPDHPAYPDLDVMPPSTPVTAKEARLYRQAALCQYIATKLLEQGGHRVPMAQLQTIERKASQRRALTSEEKVTAGLMRAIEHKAAQLMDLSHSDLLKTAKTLNLASPKDSALATSAKRDWASFNRMAAEMEEKEKEEEDDDSEGKQAFFDEILAESDEDEDEEETAGKKSAARKSKKSEDEDEDDEKKEEKKNPFASKKPKKKASTLQQIKAALALIGEDEDEEEDDDDGETASRRAEEDEEEDDDTASKKASKLLAQYLKAAKKGEDDEDDEDEDENPFASKKKASAKVQHLKRLLKAAEEEEEDEEDEEDENPFASKKKAAQNTAILNTMERKIAKLEKLLGKRADALEVAQSPFAGLVDDVIAADGVDQNDPEYGYSTAEDRMLLAALEKLERKDQKRKAQKSKTAVEVELHALLNELDRMAEGEADEADEDDDGGKKATPESQISVAPRNPNADSGAGGNIDPDQAPVTPQVEGPSHIACPEDMMGMDGMDGMDGFDDPMGIMDLGLEEGTALDSAMMPDVDPQELLDFEMMAEAQPRQAKQASTKLPLKPQPKKASAGAQRLGQVAAPKSSEVDDLSQLWGSVPDVRAHFGIPKTY